MDKLIQEKDVFTALHDMFEHHLKAQQHDTLVLEKAIRVLTKVLGPWVLSHRCFVAVSTCNNASTHHSSDPQVLVSECEIAHVYLFEWARGHEL